MLIKTRGIVLRTIKYGETSLIADIYTEEKGLQSYIIGGVRTAKPRFPAALLQVGNILDMVVYYKKPSGLHRPRELKAHYIYRELPYHLPKGAINLFAMEVAHKSIHEPEAQPLLFQWMYEFLIFLDQTKESLSHLPHLFLIQLAAHLGFEMQNNFDANHSLFDLQAGCFVREPSAESLQAGHYLLSEKENKLLSNLLGANWHEQHFISSEPATRRRLLQHLLTFYRLHFGRFGEVRSVDVLHELFKG